MRSRGVEKRGENRGGESKENMIVVNSAKNKRAENWGGYRVGKTAQDRGMDNLEVYMMQNMVSSFVGMG